MIRTLLRILIKGLLPIALLAVTAWVVHTLYVTRPNAAREDAPPPIPIVTVMDLQPQDHRITIEAYGTVIPARRVMLRTEVGGRIVDHHPALAPGGVVLEGVEVLHIDPTDYQLRVKQEEVALASAQASYDLEQGQQVVAAKEWALLKDEIDASQEMEDFALRKPQLRKAQADVEAAENRLALARLDLERTTLRAPFNALVIDESVEAGQLISSQDEVAELVGTDQFWVRAAVPYDVLSRIEFAEQTGKAGSNADLFVATGHDESHPRSAHALRLLGDLSERGRMARILISIEDPLCLVQETTHKDAPILLNSYVRLAIDGGVLENVIDIPRTALRENAKVWLRDSNNCLQIRDVDILWRQTDSVLVANAFKPGEQLITSRLAVIIPGMRVRVGELPGHTATDSPESATADEASSPSSNEPTGSNLP